MFVLAKFSYFPKGCQIQILDLFEDLEFEIRTFKFSRSSPILPSVTFSMSLMIVNIQFSDHLQVLKNPDQNFKEFFPTIYSMALFRCTIVLVIVPILLKLTTNIFPLLSYRIK